MKWTTKQKDNIRSFYPWLKLKFCTDGTVLGKRGFDQAWGVLYTPYYTELHLKEVGL